jgi:hypothetical protein
MIALMAISVGITAAKHGEARENYNIISTLIAAAISVTILWWGGFFHPCPAF